jgi:hypothetical protein
MHRFSIDLPSAWQLDEVPQPVLDRLLAKATEAGATVNLGPRAGTGFMETPLGPVELSYELENPRMWFTISQKPMLVPNSMIETGIRNGAEKYFREFPDGLSALSAQA